MKMTSSCSNIVNPPTTDACRVSLCHPHPEGTSQGGGDCVFCVYYRGQEIASLSPSGLIGQLHRMRDGLLIMTTTQKLSGFALSMRRLVFLFYALKTWFYSMQNNKQQTPGSVRSSVMQHSHQHTCTRRRRRQNPACRVLACV